LSLIAGLAKDEWGWVILGLTETCLIREIMDREHVQTQVVEAAMANWGTIVEEMEEMAEEYDMAGWETIVLHPGDIQMVSSESVKPGLDVLIPDDEYRDLETVLESGVSFDTYEVYKDLLEGVVHLIVVMEDSTTQTGLFYPAYYGVKAASTIDDVIQDGQFRTYLRRLNGEYVELTHSEPDLFAPPNE